MEARGRANIRFGLELFGLFWNRTLQLKQAGDANVAELLESEKLQSSVHPIALKIENSNLKISLIRATVCWISVVGLMYLMVCTGLHVSVVYGDCWGIWWGQQNYLVQLLNMFGGILLVRCILASAMRLNAIRQSIPLILVTQSGLIAERRVYFQLGSSSCLQGDRFHVNWRNRPCFQLLPLM